MVLFMVRQQQTVEKSPAQTPDLDEREKKIAEDRAFAGANVIHEAIRKQGEEELRRTSSGLAWSGLAAGLSMGFSMVTQGLLSAHLPDSPWRPLISKLGYSIGFLIVVLGRQQLFTENTLTPIIPLLHRRDTATLRQVLRLWTVVLATNLIGGLTFAWVSGNTELFGPETRHAFSEIGQAAARGSFGITLLKGFFAGWLIALMVWVLGGVDQGRPLIIIIFTYLVGLGDFTHIITGSIEVMYVVIAGGISWGRCFGGYMIPTLLGNILGGVSLVAVLNHAQVVAGGGKKQEE
jgi:formate-nitrite transporter family protein